MDGFKTTLHFGVAPLGTFDCILGASFCAAHLVSLDWPNHRMKLRDAEDRVHSIHGDRNFISQRKLDLIVPRSEVRQAVQQPGCLFLMIQPLDTAYELTEEELDLTKMRSKVTDAWGLDPSEQQRLDHLLEHRYAHVFEPRKGPPLERVPGESFSIQLTPEAHPQYRNYYRLSPTQQTALRELIAQYVDEGKMDLCAGSSWGAPVILVPKKDGGWRVVFDYRFLNNVTVKDRYPLPRIDDYLNNLQGARYFSSMDALDGFHQ
eukprot:scaffold2847_cov583-Pavlova_lutheri.AAC.1